MGAELHKKGCKLSANPRDATDELKFYEPKSLSFEELAFFFFFFFFFGFVVLVVLLEIIH